MTDERLAEIEARPCSHQSVELLAEVRRLAARLSRIAAIIEAVDNSSTAVDGPVPSPLQRMTQGELSEIYALAKGEGR